MWFGGKCLSFLPNFLDFTNSALFKKYIFFNAQVLQCGRRQLWFFCFRWCCPKFNSQAGSVKDHVVSVWTELELFYSDWARGACVSHYTNQPASVSERKDPSALQWIRFLFFCKNWEQIAPPGLLTVNILDEALLPLYPIDVILTILVRSLVKGPNRGWGRRGRAPL